MDTVMCMFCGATATVTVTSSGPRENMLAHWPVCDAHIEAAARRIRSGNPLGIAPPAAYNPGNDPRIVDELPDRVTRAVR